MQYEGKRARLERLRGQLIEERQSFLPTWREIGDYILPHRWREHTYQNNRGERKDQKIVDSTPRMTMRTLQSGMLAGNTSPARPWFSITVPDPDLAQYEPVKLWCNTVTRDLRTYMLRSNIYKSLANQYGDSGGFGTSPMLVEENPDTLLHSRVFAPGSYLVAQDALGRVVIAARELRMTVRQMYNEFGPENLSIHVKQLWENHHREQWVDVVHVIYPNDDYRPTMPGRPRLAKYKRFASCTYEMGVSGATGQGQNYLMNGPEENKLLRESGYDRFPVLVARWEVTGEDVYGTNCPGMTMLGDVKALMLLHKRKMQAIEKMVNPPLQGPPETRNTVVTQLPSGMNYVPDGQGRMGLRPVHEVNINVDHLRIEIEAHQMRIQRAGFEDLFLMLATMEDRQRTATEIAERKEEKLVALAPVLEQYNQDVLDPLIDLSFDFMVNQNLVAPPPDEIAGMPLKIQYESIMAQAQKMVGMASIERVLSVFVPLAEVHPGVFRKLDVEQMIDEYADAAGAPVRIVRSDEAVAEIAAQEQQAQQAAAAAEQAKLAADSVKSLAGASMEGDNALTRIARLAQAGSLT